MIRNTSITLSLLLAVCTFSASAQVKGDPWIIQAYKELYNLQPTAWEMNIQLYNNGSWKTYAELKQYVIDYQHSLANNNLTVTVYGIKNSSNYITLVNQGGKSIAVDMISSDKGAIVAQGGGNIVAQGGGNLVNTNGSNIVAQGGGNIKDLPGAALGANRSLMAGDSKIIKTSGSGAIIIRKS